MRRSSGQRRVLCSFLAAGAFVVLGGGILANSAAIAVAQAGGNTPPLTPLVTEPAMDGQTVNPADVHMETGPFHDPNVGDQHLATDWEIWTISPSQRVWASLGATGVERLHTHLGDGVFQNSHAGRSELLANTSYRLRVRHSDDSGDAATRWSAYALRSFQTGAATQVFELDLQDVSAAPLPLWRVASTGSDVILAPASTPARLRLETGSGALLLSIDASNGAKNTLTNPPALASHAAARVQVAGGSLGLTLPATDLDLVDDHCETHTILLPALSIAPGATEYFWISSAGATYHGEGSQTAPNFTTLKRALDPPWNARQAGFRVEVFASGFQLPVNIAFVPNPGPEGDAPYFYVTELYGTIRVVTRNGSVGVFASGLLNFNPTGVFPGSGEQGLAGIAVDPANGDVYATLVYASPSNPSQHFPRIDRFTSNDGGRSASNRSTVLDMLNEPQGQSHQISSLSFAPDGKLICHVGDGFVATTALALDSFRGKILRLNRNGTAPSDNPFYDAANGIGARDYVWAYGVRNPFGGAWRAQDGKHYVVENGPSMDRFSQIASGRNFGWNGNNGSMANFALYNWNPPSAPVNLAFVESANFGGSGFPASSLGHAFVSESGPTYASGPQAQGKRVTEWILDASGNLAAGPLPFLEYTGDGKATACALAAGPDGLYMSELYDDHGANATDPGARILRIRFVPPRDCNGNGLDDTCDIAGGASTDANASWTPDECDCHGTSYCSAKRNSLGCLPTIGARGSATAGAPDNFVVTASRVLNQKLGILFWGSAPAAIPFAGGFQCVQAPLHRLPVMSSGGSTTANDCSGVFAQPISDSYMQSQGLVAGSTAYFQIWSRDPGFPTPNAVSLTEGLRVLVCP